MFKCIKIVLTMMYNYTQIKQLFHQYLIKFLLWLADSRVAPSNKKKAEGEEAAVWSPEKQQFIPSLKKIFKSQQWMTVSHTTAPKNT